MSYTEPEGLHVKYRIETTKQLVKLMQQGQVFKLTALSGAGKSKYLRYLSTSLSVHNKFFKKFCSGIFYIDLNQLYNGNVESVVKIISKKLNCKIEKIE